MQRAELSGLILTHGDRDPSALLSQMEEVCDQIVIVHDDRVSSFKGSILDTLGAEVTVIEREFDTFPNQRNAGIEKALGSWVLSVDSDELLSDELMEELSRLEPTVDTDVYGISRTEIWHGRSTQTSLYCQFHPRLFRSCIRYAQTPIIHEEFEDVDYSKVVNLEYPLIHDIKDSLASIALKSFRYGRGWQADKEQKSFDNKQLLKTIPSLLLRHGYLRDGVAGLGLAMTQLAYRIGTRFPQNLGN